MELGVAVVGRRVEVVAPVVERPPDGDVRLLLRDLPEGRAPEDKHRVLPPQPAQTPALHAVGDLEDLDRATASGGALEAAIRAKEECLVGAIGITGHGHEAPATHLEALNRYPFDTVLTPWNYILSTDEDYRRDFEALVREIERQDAGLMTIKTISRRNWPEGDPQRDQRYATWYEPFDGQEHVDAAVSFVLSYEEITGIAMVGDVTLVPMMLEAEGRRIPREEAAGILAEAPDHTSPFISVPF